MALLRRSYKSLGRKRRHRSVPLGQKTLGTDDPAIGLRTGIHRSYLLVAQFEIEDREVFGNALGP